MHADRILDRLLSKALEAAEFGEAAWRVQSTGERLAVALVLNRGDWLSEMDYTVAQALDRIGADWASAVPKVANAPALLSLVGPR